MSQHAIIDLEADLARRLYSSLTFILVPKFVTAAYTAWSRRPLGCPPPTGYLKSRPFKQRKYLPVFTDTKYEGHLTLVSEQYATSSVACTIQRQALPGRLCPHLVYQTCRLLHCDNKRRVAVTGPREHSAGDTTYDYQKVDSSFDEQRTRTRTSAILATRPISVTRDLSQLAQTLHRGFRSLV